jgi:ribosomal protein S1
MAPWGIIVELAPGVEGQVHISQLSQKPTYHPKETVSVGQQIRARVLEIDPWAKKIRLTCQELD